MRAGSSKHLTAQVAQPSHNSDSENETLEISEGSTLYVLLVMLLADVGAAESGGGCIFAWSRVVDCSLCTTHCMEKGDEDRGLTPISPSSWQYLRLALSLHQRPSKS